MTLCKLVCGLLTALLLIGCSTVGGVGKDLQHGSEASREWLSRYSQE